MTESANPFIACSYAASILGGAAIRNGSDAAEGLEPGGSGED